MMFCSEMSNVYDIIVIGSGPAGYTAAIYGSRAELKVLVLEGDQPGGQLTITSEVENYPGFPEYVDGFTLVDNMKRQAERFGATCITETVRNVDFSNNPFVVSTGRAVENKDAPQILGQTLYVGKSLVIATGASARWLGLKSEEHLMNKGISACATCDGFFFKNQDIVVVGGGDSAMEEATFLTRFAKSVTLVHRKNTFRASKIMVKRAKDNDKITLKTPYRVLDILGEEKVDGIQLENTETGETELLNCTGVFMAIGHVPNTKVFGNALETDDAGYLVTKADSTETNIPGVFACGDVQDRKYRQAITAAGSGCMAALDAERWLQEHD
jgi:thioredoxin reductase (NADPH)